MINMPTLGFRFFGLYFDGCRCGGCKLSPNLSRHACLPAPFVLLPSAFPLLAGPAWVCLFLITASTFFTISSVSIFADICCTKTTSYSAGFVKMFTGKHLFRPLNQRVRTPDGWNSSLREYFLFFVVKKGANLTTHTWEFCQNTMAFIARWGTGNEIQFCRLQSSDAFTTLLKSVAQVAQEYHPLFVAILAKLKAKWNKNS